MEITTGIETIFFSPVISRQEYDFTFNSNQTEPISVPVRLEPISVAGGRVTFDSKSMVIGQWYEFQKNNKKYLAVMKSAGVIDIYRIRE